MKKNNGIYDGIMNLLSSGCDMVVVSIIWLLCCIPIFTVGAASTALYYTYHKSIRQKNGYIIKTFFHGFTSNFKKSSAVWIVVLVLNALNIIACLVLSAMWETQPVSIAMTIFLVLIITVIVVLGLYIFPYIARFENNLRNSVVNCAKMALAKLPWSVLLIILLIAVLLMVRIIPMTILIAPAIYTGLSNKILERIFRNIMSVDDLKTEMEYDRLN